MRIGCLILLGLAILLFGSLLVFLMTSDLPPPAQVIEKAIPNERMPR